MAETLQQRTGPTLDDIRAWPAAVTPAMAGPALGISRAHAYELCRQGKFPAATIDVAGRIRVLTWSILDVLGGGRAT